MQLFLLDGAGAGILLLFFGLGLLFIFLAILLETFVMLQMKYHSVIRKAFIQSLAANLLSLAAGFILIGIDNNLFQLDNIGGFGLMFAATILVETVTLYIMNEAKPVQKTILVSLVMNLTTYMLAFLITRVFN